MQAGLDEADYKEVEALAEQEHRPLAEMGRVLVMEALKERKRKKKE